MGRDVHGHGKVDWDTRAALGLAMGMGMGMGMRAGRGAGGVVPTSLASHPSNLREAAEFLMRHGWVITHNAYQQLLMRAEHAKTKFDKPSIAGELVPAWVDEVHSLQLPWHVYFGTRALRERPFYAHWYDREATMKMAVAHLLSLGKGNATVIFETGTVQPSRGSPYRERWGAGQSTLLWAKYVTRYGGQVVSVDEDPEVDPPPFITAQSTQTWNTECTPRPEPRTKAAK